MTSPRQVKPYFDYESYHDNVPSADALASIYRAFHCEVLKVFSSQVEGPAPDVD